MSLPTRRDLVRAVQEAARPISDNFRKPHTVKIKEDGTPVTSVDLAVHENLKRWTSHFPGLGYIGEEGNDFSEKCQHTLYVDPLDGTNAYRRGQANSTTVATLMRHVEGNSWEPAEAVIHDPIGGWTWSVSRGEDTLTQSNRDGVVEVHENHLVGLLAPYQVTVCVWPNVPHNLDEVLRLIKDRPDYQDQAFGSIALGAGLIASGGMHATLFGGKSAVETAAMSLIVRGAGGLATDFSGEHLGLYELAKQNGKLDFVLPNGAIMSSHKMLTKDLVQIVQSAQ